MRDLLDGTAAVRQANDMASKQDKKLSGARWAPQALLAVAATSVLTVAATLYDIL